MIIVPHIHLSNTFTDFWESTIWKSVLLQLGNFKNLLSYVAINLKVSIRIDGVSWFLYLEKQCILIGNDNRFSLCIYRMLIKYCVFSLKCCNFSDFCKFCCSAGCVWPAIVYTHWHRGETARVQSPEYILKSSKKHNI